MAERHKWHAETLAELAAFLGKSPHTVRHWLRHESFPRRDEQRGYDLAEVHHWVLAFEARKRKSAPQGEQTNAELEHEKLQIDVAARKLKLQQQAGELVLRENAYSTIETMFHKVRTRLQAIPEELASSLPPEVRAEYVHDAKHKIRLILTEMSNWGIAED
jgi:predicted transcriptional regulator